MNRTVIVLPAAKEDLYGILAWIKHRSPAGAKEWFRAWNDALQRLEREPLPGKAPEDADHDLEIRQLLFKTRRGRVYRAMFTIRDDHVVVLRIRGPGQDLLSSDELDMPPTADE